MLAYEPILLLTAVAIFLRTDSFTVQSILDTPSNLLPYLPLAFIAVLIALTIKMRKSPFDISASEHAAHQELVRGVYTEYSGPYFALIELTYWYELVFILTFIALFWAHPIWVGVLIALGCYLFELFLDNITARLTWGWMLKLGGAVGVVLVLINMVPWVGGFW
jgi:formate hydrogenlyase subunit 4